MERDLGLNVQCTCRLPRFAMHEMGIANSVLEEVARQMRQHPAERVSRVGLRIGEFAGVDPDSLRFCFEAIVKEPGTGAARTRNRMVPSGRRPARR